MVRVENSNFSEPVPDKRLHLKFQTNAYGDGEISVSWPRLFDRGIVQVDFKKTSQLPDGPAGEILARALGYTYGFIPKKSLALKIENVGTRIPASNDSVTAVARWALAMHGQKALYSWSTDSDYTVLSIGLGFRAAPRFFEEPNTHLGHTADGPQLGDPEIFVNVYPWDQRLHPTSDLPLDVFLARDLTAEVRRRESGNSELPQQMPFIYVVPVPEHAQDPTLPYIGLGDDVHHRDIAQGRSAYAAGYGHAVYDPHFGRSGGYRVQFLVDPNAQFAGQGKKAKQAAEAGLQHLDAEGRWFSLYRPVSIEPFAGLQVHHKSSATSPTSYEIKIPDARALSYQGGPLQQAKPSYADLASMVIESVERQAGQLPLARVSEVALGGEILELLPTFVGQALAAVQLMDSVTGTEQLFGGLLVSEQVWNNIHSEAFIEGLTIYGLEKQLGTYSPEEPFVLQRKTDAGDIELTINPDVLIKR